MKKLTKSLLVLMLMLGTMLEMKAADVAPGYYLVGNFFSEHNVGGDVNPGGDDPKKIDYTKHVYFKFEQQKDNSYAFSIPACPHGTCTDSCC